MRKGENISAKEIEDLLYTHPKVIEVAVIGLPDAERGERVCAVVQLADDADALELAEVVAFCRDAGLMTQKIPEQLELRTEWPRAGTGKIVKKTLRDEYAARRERRRPGRGRRRCLPGPIGDQPYRVVFVCTGQHLPLPHGRGHHPCAGRRRPTLEDGTTLGEHLDVRSAGTGPWHEGEPMHPGAAEPSSGPATPASATSHTSSRRRSSAQIDLHRRPGPPAPPDAAWPRRGSRPPGPASFLRPRRRRGGRRAGSLLRRRVRSSTNAAT